MQTVYTVTTAFNGDSPDGSAGADVRVFGTLESARAFYENARRNYGDYIGPVGPEAQGGPAPDVLPEHGWRLSYSAFARSDSEFDEEDEVGIELREHDLADPNSASPLALIHLAVMHFESAADQLEAIYRVLGDSGYEVP